MNEHFASIAHRDKAAQFQAEAKSSRLASSARSEGAGRMPGLLGVSRRRIAALVAAILPTSGR